MKRIRHIIREIHRRSVWQVLGIYLVGSWVGYQVILDLADGMGLPDWVPPFAVVLFIIGLPIVLATAFVQEGLPGGAPDDDIPAPASPASLRPAPEPATAPESSWSWLTWRRSLVAGMLAFLLLGLTAATYMVVRSAGVGPFGSLMAAGKLDDQARILIADFRSTVGDTTLAAVVTEAFRIDLARSTTARLVEPRDVRDVLRRMGRTDVPRLDGELTREIALRDGIHAYILGEVAPAAGGYVLTARLISTDGDEVLTALRETARSDDDLIPAIDRLSRSLRKRTGESLSTIRRTEPLAKVTTSSLAALEKYTQASRASAWLGDPQLSLELHQEAVALDSTFAAAHHALAVINSNRYRFEEALAALERALRWQDRLTEAQRHGAQGLYHAIRRDHAQAAAAYERALVADPTNFGALNNLALAYGNMGDHERAAHHYRRAIALDTLRFFAYANLGETLVMMGRHEAALDTFAVAARLAPASAWAVVGVAFAAYPAGDYDGAETNLRRLLADESVSSATRQRAAQRLRMLLLTRGRFAESMQVREALLTGTGDRASAEREMLGARFWYQLGVLEEPEQARRTLARWRPLMEAAGAQDSIQFVVLAEACAWLEDVRCARESLTRSGMATKLEPWTAREVYFALGAIAMAEGDTDAAIRHFRSGADPNCPRCEDEVVGLAFERGGQPDSAIAAYERFVSTPSMDRIFADGILGSTLRRLGGLYEDRGDRARAAGVYTKLLTLWARADPELQPAVADVRARIGRLQPDR